MQLMDWSRAANAHRSSYLWVVAAVAVGCRVEGPAWCAFAAVVIAEGAIRAPADEIARAV